MKKLLAFDARYSRSKLYFLAKLYFLVLIVYTLFFLPIVLNSGIYIDDVILLTSVYSTIKFYKASLAEISFKSIVEFLISGRVYGIYFFLYIPYYFTHKVLTYQISKAVYNLICVLAFARFVKLLTRNDYNYWAFIFLMPIVFLASNSDPLTSQGLSTQLTLVFVALTICCYVNYQNNQKKAYYYLSIFFFFWSFFYYEIALCIVPIMIILATRFRLQKTDKIFSKNRFLNYCQTSISVCFKELKIHLLIFIIWVITCFIVRNMSERIYDGINFNFNFQYFYLAWLIQTIRALPLSFSNSEHYLGLVSYGDVFLGFVLFVLCYAIFIKILPKINFQNYYRDLILIGLSLSLIPPFILSLPLKYQLWAINYNSSYVQLFIQFFGIVLLIILYVDHLIKNSLQYNSRFKHQIFLKVIAIIISAVIAITCVLNKNYTLKKNISLKYDNYKNLVEVSKLGIMDDMPKNLPQYFDFLIFEEINYQTSLEAILTKNKNHEKYFLNKFYDKKNKLLNFVNGIYHPSFFNYHLKTDLIVISEIGQKGLDFIKSNSDGVELKNFYYLEDGKNEKSFSKNLSGFVLFGKLNKIKYKCLEKSAENNCNFILNLSDVKIFINKQYSFKLESIINELNSRFGEKIFNDSIDKLRIDLEKSSAGIFIKLESKNYNLTRGL